MPSRPETGTSTFTVSAAAAAALRAVSKRWLTRATATGAFERNLAAGLRQIQDPDVADPRGQRLIARHTALSPLPPPAGDQVRLAGDSLPWDPHVYDEPARSDEWRFYVTDATRKWGSCGEIPTLGLAFYGYGDTVEAALAEAEVSRRSDFVAVFAEDGDERVVFPAVRSVDLSRVEHLPEARRATS